MEPYVFTFQYHNIAVVDPLQGISATLDIQEYISGWNGNGHTDNNSEYWRILSKLAPLLKLKTAGAVVAAPQPVYFKNSSKVRADEEWYIPSLRRAYEGRASPEEFCDAARIAVLTGQTTPGGLHAYSKKYFGLDCNTLVGNWLGISPSTAIAAYAHGYGTSKTLSGATPDVYTTRDRVPLPPIRQRTDLQQGNVLATYTATADDRGRTWRHIALVQDIKLVDDEKALISITEWGDKGAFSKHYRPNGLHRVKRGRVCNELPNTDFFYIETEVGKSFPMDEKKVPAFRLFFDSRPLDEIPCRGYHVGGVYGT